MMADQVWAEEGGIMVRAERVGGRVAITIMDVSGGGNRPLATATLGGWRWDRLVAAVADAPAAPGESQ
jgi:hypothetical protein